MKSWPRRSPSDEGTAARKPRVLIIVQNLPVPLDRRVWLEATTLARAGYAVSVICPKMRGLDKSHEILEDVEIFRYWLPFDAQGAVGFMLEFAWCFLCSALLSVWIAMFGRGVDILQACNPPETYWPLGLAFRAVGKVFIFDHHDLSPEMFSAKFGRQTGLFYRALLAMEWLTFKSANLVITTNHSHKAIAVARGGKLSEDVYVVRSGPELARFRVTAREQTWHNGKRFLVAYLGEICAQDGVEHLVNAMKILRDVLGRQDVQCVFMGSGPHQPAIVRYAAQIGISDRCTFLGRVSDEILCRVLSSSDVAVDPDPKSDWSDKSTMNKVIEYMYFGVPVIAYDLCETRISAGAAASYVEPNSEHALAMGIVSLLDAPIRRHEMAEVGMRRVRTALAWDYSAPVLLDAYARALRIADLRLPRAD